VVEEEEKKWLHVLALNVTVTALNGKSCALVGPDVMHEGRDSRGSACMTRRMIGWCVET